MTKKPTIDIDTVNAALARAAAAAKTGSRDVRAGKFVATSSTRPAPAKTQAASAKPKK